jgi:hypothetical protein
VGVRFPRAVLLFSFSRDGWRSRTGTRASLRSSSRRGGVVVDGPSLVVVLDAYDGTTRPSVERARTDGG